MFFIDTAMAATTSAHTAQAANGFSSIFFILVILVAGYLFMVRPQMKRNKEHRNLVNSVSVGDEVVTSGGMLGKISKVEDNFFQLEIAPNTHVRIQRGSISTVLPKGTVKASA